MVVLAGVVEGKPAVNADTAGSTYRDRSGSPVTVAEVPVAGHGDRAPVEPAGGELR